VENNVICTACNKKMLKDEIFVFESQYRCPLCGAFDSFIIAHTNKKLE